MDQRIVVVAGHFGSGKTEFSVNYALNLARAGKKTALVDLDIANPYFRSRMRQTLLEENGIQVYSTVFGQDITADLPAITARARAPMEDPDCHVVVDAGGNDVGARVLIQFKTLLTPDRTDLFFVVNGRRPETSRLENASRHLEAIQMETGLSVTGLVNNTHLLLETQVEDVLYGAELTNRLSQRYGIPVRYTCVKSDLADELSKALSERTDLKGLEETIVPLELQMRKTWLDR